MGAPSEQRSRIMRAVKGRNTKPEMLVRRVAHAAGYRYRLHQKNLPGRPDLVFPKRRKVIFVHGCFWHGHNCARGSRVPKTNQEYWIGKVRRNVERDTLSFSKLQELGWGALTLWECELKDIPELEKCLKTFLDG